MPEAQRRLEERARQETEKTRGTDDESDEEKPPKGGATAEPRPEQQINLTDPDRALMRKSRRHGWEQAYNAQAVVDADGSQLILAAHVSRSPTDAGELEWASNTMSEKIRCEEGRRIYAKRKSTVEPTFGIIKAPMGFRQFLLRGMEKLSTEWTLVCTAYNLKRLWALKSE